MMNNQIATPGARIGHVSEYVSGDGTFIRDGYIFASRVGTIVAQQEPRESKKRLFVLRDKAAGNVPHVGSIVVGRISKMTYVSGTVDIMIVDNQPVRESFTGTIRKQDARSFDRDTVDLSEFFLPGDIVKAEVLSLGDAHSYYLSTAKNEFGVIYAESASGAQMSPISWTEMKCSKTGAIEKRKCAKPSISY